jgi:DNA-binding CsgD family transcriptional regulator
VTYTDLAEPVIVRLETALGKITRSTKRSRLAMRSTDPFLVSKSTRGSRSSRTVAWYATLRRVLGADALFVVPVHRFESVAGIATFAGQAVNFDSHTRSFLCVLASAGFARAAELAGLPTPQTRQARLSARELACLGHYSKDRSVPEIGRRLGITARTVRFHLDNARTKLSVVTRAQAVRKATRQGLIVKA